MRPSLCHKIQVQKKLQRISLSFTQLNQEEWRPVVFTDNNPKGNGHIESGEN